MRDVTIDFPGVKALDGVDFRLLPGEIHALMGENGAGKSTLIKALTGVYDIDAGTIVVDGVEQRFNGPRQAQSAGISTVYQEVNLCANLTVAENILLGREPRRHGRIDHGAMNANAGKLLGELDLAIDPRSTLGDHPIAVAQLVAIARAMAVSARVLILDEPTSSLDPKQRVEVRDLIVRLRGEHTVVLSTHILPEVSQVTDRVVIINRGKVMAVDTPDNLSQRLRGREEVTVEVAGADADAVRQAVTAIPGVTRVAVDDTAGGRIVARIQSDLGTDVRADVARALASRWRLLGLRSESLSLEEIFLKLTGDGGSEGPARQDSAQQPGPRE
jgi:ABC-type sugar transport system ATPase subunit